MHTLVRQFIAKKEAEIQKKTKETKDQFAIVNGLYEKQYVEYSQYEDSYEYGSEKDKTSGKYLYFKKVPVVITDEEYEIMRDLSNKAKRGKYNPNVVSRIFLYMAITTYIIGGILGFVFGFETTQGYYSSHTEFNFGTALIFWGSAFLSGHLLLWCAEVIKLLQAIKDKK